MSEGQKNHKQKLENLPRNSARNREANVLLISTSLSKRFLGAILIASIGGFLWSADITAMSSGTKTHLFSKAHAQENLPISLTDALAIGISTNPEYGTVASSRRATDEELRQGKALFLPSVDTRADAGWEHSDDPATRAGAGDDEENMFRYDLQVTLTQLLFDGWESRYEVERQKARVNSAAYRVRETAELVGLSIVESYLEVLRQRQLLMISRENEIEHLSILTMIENGVGAGRNTQADLEQARARLAEARANIANTTQALRNAESVYKQEVGDAPGFLELPRIPYGSLEPNIEEEVLRALAFSPTLDIFESDIEVAYAEAQGTRSTFYPNFDLELNARHGEDLGGVEGDDTSASALVVMNWNLYRGGSDMARSREFIHRHQQTKEERSEAARALESDVRQTWASMEASATRAQQFAAQAAANSQVVKAYRDQFSLNRRTLLDVLDAQNELFVSRSNTISSEYLEMLAVFRLLALKGSLLPTMGLEYPEESKLASEDRWSEDPTMKAR